MIAGIDYSTGDGIICMDADLQHPPECIPEIIEKFNDGYEVINMVRTQNKSAGLVKNITSSGFYWLINHISDVHFEPNASDFFAISRHVAQVLKDNYREKSSFPSRLCTKRRFQKDQHRIRSQSQSSRRKQIQHQKTVHILHKYDTLLLQYATKTGNLRRYAISIPLG